MKAQAYYKDNPPMIRIFLSKSLHREKIAELPLCDTTDKEADLSLRRIGLIRRSPWIEYDHMMEAKVRFHRVRRRNGG